MDQAAFWHSIRKISPFSGKSPLLTPLPPSRTLFSSCVHAGINHSNNCISRQCKDYFSSYQYSNLQKYAGVAFLERRSEGEADLAGLWPEPARTLKLGASELYQAFERADLKEWGGDSRLSISSNIYDQVSLI